ncbi:uncharacterized protein Z518_07261 [Rhinocladiella mackenziei CBS 650.93]|uniref:Transcription factor hoxa13 n=1 Tax=Rhinocladiella mackenziei CBS 650.93 TaxID=1442369 RepID=A0A0D2GZT2_9EURO|nr:uncharacterized protein Z518_07261 [Rhinocladiella mackenziei CBS 650.93]KIX03708.1 hypothetical protein Z518_07261 [Rhinocladiella mackenziei CBS 650.93]
MAVAENGRPVESVKDRPNGHGVGPVARRAPARRRSWTFWLFNNLARLTVWYVLLTILFRCPSTLNDLAETCPKICQPYLTAKAYVQPHLQPYYDEYAGPYVEKAQPYADSVNRRLVRPASTLARDVYDKYAAPQIDAAKAYSHAQWEKSVTPQINRMRENAVKTYDTNIGPHVDEFTAWVGPYYTSVRDNAGNIYQRHILPSVEYSRPYLKNAYRSSQDLALNTVYPFARHAWSELIIFWDGTFWPFLKGLYIDNVRPQLVMINERIAKYQESRKLKAAMDEVDISQSVPPRSPTPKGSAGMDEVYAMFETDDEELSSTTTVEETASTRQAPVRPPPEVATEEKITEDLRAWQKKFAVAADKGTDDLRERVTEIVASLVQSDLDGTGRGLATALEKTVEVELDNVKTKIKSIIGALPDDASAEEVKKAAADILGAIRSSGVAIKDRAKKVREWSQNFERGLVQRLAAASASTLEVLDGIKDLGLQEVGMRWAWMEGVTYKHWKKFHQVRKKLDEWKLEVRNVAMESPEAVEAISAARQIMEESMAITEDAAQELIRLKGVAQWKLRERDATDDFGSRRPPAEAASADSSLTAELEGATSQGVEPTGSVWSQASEAATEALSSASSAAAGSSTGTLESAASKASGFADDASSSASSAVEVSTQDPVESMMSEVSATVEDAYEFVSSVIMGTSTGTAEAVLSQASESSPSRSEDVLDSISSVSSLVESVTSPSTDDISSLSSEAEEKASSASSVADSATSQVSSKVFAGAMAQEVKGSTPILDDVFDSNEALTFSEKVQHVVNEAGDRYADVTRAVSEAMSGTSQGSMESITSVASEQYASALAAASSVLYGTPQGTAEGIASVASEKYEKAVAAASSVIFGTPTPDAESLLTQASSSYTDAISRAEEHYTAAKSIASEKISGTPKPIHEEMFSSIESAYSGAREIARNRLDAARRAASPPYSSVSKQATSAFPASNPLDSVTSLASSVLQDALTAASAQYSQVRAAVGATPTPAQERYLQEAKMNFYAAIGMAHEQYEDFIAVASSAIYGTPTTALSRTSRAASIAMSGTPVPAYQSLIGAAASQYSEASSAAVASLQSDRSSINSAATPAQSLLDEAMEAYSSALDVASSAMGLQEESPAQDILDGISSQYDAAISAASSSRSAASSAMYGAPTSSVESITSVASQNWEALISKASEQIYGAPKPFSEQPATQAGGYSAKVADFGNDQYAVIQSYVSELIIGKEPDFTESVMSRLSSAYYTGCHQSLASSASSFASESYQSASSVASVAATYFTPPPEVSSILNSITNQLGAVVNAANVQIHGTRKGTVEQATSTIADSYSSASSAVSEAIDGSPAGDAVKSILDVAKSGQEAISFAIYGTPTGTVESLTSLAADMHSSVSSVVADNVAAAASAVGDIPGEAASKVDAMKAKVSEVIYGPEQSALESAHSRIADAVESAKSAIASMVSDVEGTGTEMFDAVSSSVKEMASQASGVASSAVKSVKDEL